MRMALLGEAPISSQMAEKRSFSSLHSLAEIDSDAAAVVMIVPRHNLLFVRHCKPIKPCFCTAAIGVIEAQPYEKPEGI